MFQTLWREVGKENEEVYSHFPALLIAYYCVVEGAFDTVFS